MEKKVVRAESFYKWAIFYIWYMITMHIASSQSDIYHAHVETLCIETFKKYNYGKSPFNFEQLLYTNI